MSDVPNKQFIEDIAIEMGTDPAYVEKDWFAVQLLKHILLYQSDFDFIFTGGTSLSKGYGLINRFSEDLDFLVFDRGASNQKTRSNFKRGFVEYVKSLSGFAIVENSLEAFNNNKSFKFAVCYSKTFKSSSLRDYLQVEIKFLSTSLLLERRAIRSFVSEYRKAPEETSSLCVSPIEIAGDKLSALTWRILSCDRESKDYKPQIIRHLHDLAWLKEIIDGSPVKFNSSVIRAFENDQNQGGDEVKQMSLFQRINKTLELLDVHPGYKDDYNKYVLDMSYSKDDDRISYESTISIFNDICNLITEYQAK